MPLNGKPKTNGRMSVASSKALSEIVSLLTRIGGQEVQAPFDVSKFDDALKKSVWLHAAVYRLAFALENVGFKVIDESTGEEAQGAKADEIRLLMRRVNPEDTYSDFIEQNMVHLSVAGETFIEKARDKTGAVRELWVWSPKLVTPIKDKSGKRRIAAFTFKSDGNEKTLPVEDVIFCKVYNPSDPLRGQAAAAPMWNDILSDESAAKHNKSLLKKGMRPGGILQCSPEAGDLGDNELRQLRESIKIAHDGPDNAGKLLVLPGGLNFQRDMFSAKDMEFLDSRRFTREIAAGLIGVPPITIGNFDAASYANTEQQLRAFWQHIGKPWLMKLFGSLNEHFIHPEIDENLSLIPNMNQIDTLVDDESTRVQNTSALVQGGVMMLNEGRRALGLKPIDGGDCFFRPLNLEPTPQDQIGQPPDQQQQDPQQPDGQPAANTPPATNQDVAVTQDAVLNGAQISAATQIVSAVALGEIPRDAGLGQLEVLFNLTADQAEQIMGSAGLPGVPTTPNPVPVQEQPPPKSANAGLGLRSHWRDKARRSIARAAHDRALLQAERKMQRRIAGYLAQARDRAIDKLKMEGAASGDMVDPEVEKREASKALIPAILEVIQDAGETTLSRLGGKSIKGDLPTGSLPPQIVELLNAFSLENPRVLAFLETIAGKNIESITTEMLAQVRSLLADGASQGLGVSELVVKLEDATVFQPTRAEKIARTETIGAFSFGTQEAFRATGTPRKSWLTTGDDRVRQAHRDLERQSRKSPIDATGKFTMRDPEKGRTTEIAFPADPEAPGWATINCRCALLPEDEAKARNWIERCKTELGLEEREDRQKRVVRKPFDNFFVIENGKAIDKGGKRPAAAETLGDAPKVIAMIREKGGSNKAKSLGEIKRAEAVRQAASAVNSAKDTELTIILGEATGKLDGATLYRDFAGFTWVED